MIRKQKTITPEQAQTRLEDMCVAAEHCEGEMREKLRKWMIPSSSAEAIISHLKEKKFIDDRRFAEAYARDKYRFARWGKRKIAMGLAAKRVGRDVVAEALDAIDEKEYEEIAADVFSAKLRMHPDLITTFEGRTKLFRFMIGRGYESDLVTRLLKNSFAQQHGVH